MLTHHEYDKHRAAHRPSKYRLNPLDFGAFGLTIALAIVRALLRVS